jgi:hypothetical protein
MSGHGVQPQRYANDVSSPWGCATPLVQYYGVRDLY